MAKTEEDLRKIECKAKVVDSESNSCFNGNVAFYFIFELSTQGVYYLNAYKTYNIRERMGWFRKVHKYVLQPYFVARVFKNRQLLKNASCLILTCMKNVVAHKVMPYH